MSTLADIIDERRASIVEMFTERVKVLLAPRPLRDSELIDHLPQFLDEVAAMLRSDVAPPGALFAASPTAKVHGRQRLHLGYDLMTVVQEYGLLRDCVLAHLDEARSAAELHELRMLSDYVSAAVGQAVTAYAQDRQRQVEETEAALRMSEERYRSLFGAIDDGYCVIEVMVDDDGRAVDYRFLETNAAFARQTGLVSAAGKRIRELVPDLDASWFERYGQVAATGEPARFENHAPAMGRWFDVFASRVGRPELRQVALVFKDVTERRRVEQEREQVLALESAARAAAEDASRVRDEFLATVSHELRTPLTAILGWAQMLRAAELSEDKRERALATVERNARALGQLVEDLLDVSRILAGKLRLEIEPVEVQAVVQAALETVRPVADAKDVRIEETFVAGGTVLGDPNRLQQVVWNLLSNAVKFTPSGGRVHVAVDGRDALAAITITDTGQGIDKEFQPYIFERFRQADGTTTRTQGGLGLGLAIVHQLVGMHGGTVSVHSEGRGLGSQFIVQLPLAAVHPRVVVPPLELRALPIECAPELAQLHVLVVDDEEDARELVRTLLESCRARVATAGSVREAVQLFEADRPDLVVSDIGMPEEDGYALVRTIRARSPEAGGEVPVVALTAYARSEDRTRALRAGFSNHVAKPVEPSELLAVITSLVGRAGKRRSAR